MSPLTPFEWQALFLSVQVAFFSTIICLLPALGFGWLLAKKEFLGKWFLDGLLNLPLVLPPVTVGYLLLVIFGKKGILGGWLNEFGIGLSFSFYGAVLASAIVSFPLVIRSIRVCIETRNNDLEDVANTLGASPWRSFLTITIPLAIPGIASGVLIGFARSLGEFGATMTFAGNLQGETQTLPLAIYTQMQSPNGENDAQRLVWISIVLSLFAMMTSEWVIKRMRRDQGKL